MKVFFSTSGRDNIGGGFSFARNLWKGLKPYCFLTDDINDDFDVALIVGPTTIERAAVEKIRQAGKAIICRADNIPEDYRNRGTAISRLKDFSKLADVVVYQSDWALKYIMPLTGADGTVILNGVDTDIFNTDGRGPEAENKYLYVRSSTNENKRWQEAKYFFRMEWMQNKSAFLTVVGNFADYVKLYSIDFINKYKLGMFDEPFQYLGQIDNPEMMASIYKQHKYLIAPYFNDACSNIICEAIACGMEIMPCASGMTGGTPELLRRQKEFISLDFMATQYMGVFELALSV